MTRTHTVFFSVETLKPLAELAGELERDWERRKPYMSIEAGRAGRARLKVLMEAIVLLSEPVAESFE